MYYKYYGLNQAPFKITPDTRLFFPGGNRGAILEALIYAIVSGEGIVKVVGEVGSGKTMLCRMLTVELPEHVEVVYLANPSLSPDNILHAIAFELKLDVKPDDDRLEVMNKLQDYLLQRHAEGRQVVVFVEEAQSMPLPTLEQIRLLSNLETNENKLIQIILFGQPELDQMIARREIRQLKERITYSFNLGPLKSMEIRDYVNTRLRACGNRSDEIFTPRAINQISKYSNGLLRRINILSDKAMLASYASNDQNVRSKHVKLAARDTEFINPWDRYRLPAFVLVIIILITLLGLFTPLGQSVLRLIKGETTPVADVTGPRLQDNEPNQDTVIVELPAADPASQASPPVEDNALPADVPVLPQTANNVIDDANAPWDQLDDKNTDDQGDDMPDFLESERYTVGLLSSDELMGENEHKQFMQQLEKLPPESIYKYQVETPCNLCTLIVYRPIKHDENL